MSHEYVLPFADPQSVESDLVGGKGANLGHLTAAGFPVPAGFTVTTAAYAAVVTSDGLVPEIRALLDSVPDDAPDELERATTRIRDLVASSAIPPAIEQRITAAYTALGDDAFVAVRSSGTAEDLAGASFAGLHDTYLDIRGVDGVLDAVRRCWASLWTSRAVAYRGARGFGQDVGIAVVVQTMVPSEVSGVMFTANPLTTATDELLINSSWGLGEAIVSGITTPDEFRVAHRDLSVIARRLGAKEKQVVRDPRTGVGTIEQETPAADRERFTLDDAELAELADLGRRVQRHYGDYPQDTEWGYADGSFYLLQSRPVTGVDFTWDEELEYWHEAGPSADDEVFTRSYSDSVWGGGCTPLFYSMRGKSNNRGVHYALRLWGIPEVARLRAFRYYKGVPYWNSNMEAELLRKSAFPTARAGMIDNVPPAWREDVMQAPLSIGAYLWIQLRCQLKDRTGGAITWRKGHDQYVVDGVQKANGLTAEELRRLSDEELVRYCQEMDAYDVVYVEQVWTPFFLHARDSMGLLGWILANWYDGENEMAFTEVLTGVPRPTQTQVENTLLWELARDIRTSEALSATFAAHDGASFFAAAGDTEEGQAWLQRYDAFVAEHGHRGHANRDMFHARRHEDPAIDYRALKSIIAAGATEHPTVAEHALEAKRQRVIDEIAENLSRKPLGTLRAHLFRGLADYVMTFLLFRDDERHWVDRVTYSLKRGFQELNHRLRDRELLQGDDDFYFLADRDLYGMLRTGGRPPLADEKIAARKRRFTEVESGELQNPMYLRGYRGADDELLAISDGSDDGVLRGAGTSGGVIEGRARVVRSIEDIGLVQKGEILVVNATDPGWTPVFMAISGVVIETGGILAHASCLAREYGMPAVHLPGAMALIPHGSQVRMNGDAGTVEVLDVAATEPEPVEAVTA
ncbi:PEP/pyruvate-binding domain-containing protein [Patulibacter sp. NPDC049589]|uniref:PEP/pyruvate-binding domain-containing protein n=1 Tax=Patulibacter sp. NPDC049589 TaxID=3154731 RepID=UPI003415DF54